MPDGPILDMPKLNEHEMQQLQVLLFRSLEDPTPLVTTFAMQALMELAAGDQALMERMQHENWGYLTMPKSFTDTVVAWNKKRYGLTVDPESVVITTGVHPGIIAALRTFCPPGSKVLSLGKYS